MKKILAILLSVVLMAAVCGCGASGRQNDAQEQPEIQNGVDSREEDSLVIDEPEEEPAEEPEEEPAEEPEEEPMEEPAEEPEEEHVEEPAEEPEQPEEALENGLRPDFKNAMDSYEAFMQEYCEFMKKYEENPGDLSMLVDYTKYMAKYAEAMEALEAWDESDMNDAELKYYLEVTSRVTEMLLDAAA